MKIGQRLTVGAVGETLIGIWTMNSETGLHKVIRKEKYKDYTIEKFSRYRLTLKAYSRYTNGYTPPIYDDAYFEAMEIMDNDTDDW